jgi:hypothetical protein
MGACNCIQSSGATSGELNTEGSKSEYYCKIVYNVARKFTTNPRLLQTLKRVQARLRGLLVRNKVRASVNPKKALFNRDNYGKYHTIQQTKIVRLTPLTF